MAGLIGVGDLIVVRLGVVMDRLAVIQLIAITSIGVNGYSWKICCGIFGNRGMVVYICVVEEREIVKNR